MKRAMTGELNMREEAGRILRCAKCAEVYNLVVDSNVGMYDQGHADLRSSGVSGIRFRTSLSEKPLEDVVLKFGLADSTKAKIARREALDWLLTSLSAGQSRRWLCGKCWHVHDYPISFYTADA